MLLAVCARPPDPAAADPAVRRTGRLLAGLARRGIGVRLATREPGAAGGARLAEAGVALVALRHAAAELADRMPGGLLDGVATVLVDDLGGPLAALVVDALAVRPAEDRPRLVALVGPLASAATEAVAHLPGAHHLEGLDLLVGARREAERAALDAADAVWCHDRDTAVQVGALGGATPVVVLPAPVGPDPRATTAGTVEWGFAARSGLAVPGHFLGRPGLVDEEGLQALGAGLAGRPRLARLLAPATVVGLDGPVRALAAARALGHRRDDRSWDEVRRRRRAALVVRRTGGPLPLLVHDLVAAGLPFVAPEASLGATDRAVLGEAVGLVAVADRMEGLARVEELLADRRSWGSVRDALLAAARADDAPDPVEVVAELLGADAASARPGRRSGAGTADAPAWGTVPPPAPPGTLAAADPVAEALERRWSLGWSLDRSQAMAAQNLLGPEASYRLWRQVHEERPDELARLARRGLPGGHRPTFTVVVPCWRTDPALLDATVGSVLAQAWPHWQLVLVDDASGDPALTAALDRWAAHDRRIEVAVLAEGAGIAGATRAGLARATGEWVALLDHDDELHPAALWRVAERIDAGPDVDAVYTDEDKLDPGGRRVELAGKPDHDPDLALGVNVANHLTVVRRRLLEALGGWRDGLDGAQDHDLWLRIEEHTDRIAHVARPLYHWRQVAGSTAAAPDAKPVAGAAGHRAVVEALARRGLQATVETGALPTWHRIRWPVAGSPLVSVIIPLRDRPELLERCVARLRATVVHPAWELVLVDNASREPATLALLDELAAEGATVVRYPHEFHFARQVDLGAEAARGEVLAFLNNDAVAEGPGWFEEMLGHALRPEVGLVGARMHTETGYTQHEGIVLGVGGVAWNLRAGHHGLWNRTVRDAAGVTAAAAMVRAEVFRAVGGFDDQLRVANNDVDLGLRIGARGWRVLYTPWAELTHAESASRGPLHPLEDERRFIARWGAAGTLRDPFWDVNLDIPEIDLLAI